MKGVIVPMVAAIVEKDGKYLMIRRSENNITGRNQWQFPEGKIRFGENPEDALKRELKEETGLDLISADFLNYHSAVAKFKIGAAHMLRLFFKCNVEGKVRLSKEHRDWNFFDVEEMENLDIVKTLKMEEIRKMLEA